MKICKLEAILSALMGRLIIIKILFEPRIMGNKN
tara:strand:- start:3346 stop:3447 length:102 start_codon:yes stop_codon:yes gene_type:complete